MQPSHYSSPVWENLREIRRILRIFERLKEEDEHVDKFGAYGKMRARERND